MGEAMTPLSIVTNHPNLTETHEINGEAWEEWDEFRRVELRKKIGPIAKKKQQKLLAQYSQAIQQEIMDTSINAGWAGLFHPKNQGRAPQATQSTRRTAIIDDLTDTSWAN
jgi:hypothetical protein